MSQPKINLKQNIKHNTAQYGFEGVMKHFLKVLFDTEAPLQTLYWCIFCKGLWQKYSK